MYCCVMFPYPSGDGLHVGHAYNYAVMDSYCRWMRTFHDEAVFQPFGYDAFGLPAENYARKVGGDPREITYANIARFSQQMDRLNTQYEYRLTTCDPSYCKWTQWLFLKLKERGLAYKKFGSVNWCDSCQTVLANEQVKNGKCDRCDGDVSSRELNQWYFKITDYRERLIRNLDRIQYPASTIAQQRHWLENLRDWCVSRQRPWGCPIPVEGESDTLDTFVDSSFYYLRYLTDSDTEYLPSGSYKPVDVYVGGAEHACMHLIYARFVHMFLYDIGVVPQEEPFNFVYHQGIITKDGAKMSKSRGNTVSLDDYDPDELRMYLMFIGPYSEGGNWNDRGVVGIRRFAKRMKDWLSKPGTDELFLGELIDGIDYDMKHFRFNKIFPKLCEFLNANKEKRPRPADILQIHGILHCLMPSTF